MASRSELLEVFTRRSTFGFRIIVDGAGIGEGADAGGAGAAETEAEAARAGFLVKFGRP